MLQKYHQVNHSVNFNACLLWFWCVHLTHLHVHSTAYRVCMTSYIISTYIQHQPTNLYRMGINSLAMVYCIMQKQNKCWGCTYLSCKLVQNTFYTVEILQDSAQLESTHIWYFLTKRWSVLSLGDPPAYPFTSIPYKIYAWTLKCGHIYLTMAVWPSLSFMPTENL
jgi:hypothetical protein